MARTRKDRALIFDLNGTLVNDMDYHIKAWRQIVHDLGKPLSYEEVQAQCYGKNGDLLERIFPHRFSDEEKSEIGFNKEKAYQTAFRPLLKLIPGTEDFLQKANDLHLPMAIGSAAIRFNIDFVLDGTGVRSYFDAIVSADDVTHSKPDPETFLSGAEKMEVDPSNCIVFEDAPKGVEAAANAGMKAVVLTTMHDQSEFRSYNNIICFIEDYRNSQLASLIETHWSRK